MLVVAPLKVVMVGAEVAVAEVAPVPVVAPPAAALETLPSAFVAAVPVPSGLVVAVVVDSLAGPVTSQARTVQSAPPETRTVDSADHDNDQIPPLP